MERFAALFAIVLLAGCTQIIPTPDQRQEPVSSSIIAAPVAAVQPITQFSTLGVETDRGLLFTLESVYFDVDRASLRPEARFQLDQIATDIAQYSMTRRIMVEGHTDSTGATSYNQTLSERRADTVRRALTERGIDISRIRARGMGEMQPVASNSNRSGRQQNRRVEITLLNEGLLQ